MAFKRAWWTRIAGGSEAIARVASFGVSARLRRAQSIRSFMPAMRDTEVGTAAVTAGLDPGTARRLDVASSADRALKRGALYDDAGVPDAMRDPRDSRPAQAANAAFDAKLIQDQQKPKGFWDGVGDWLSNTFTDADAFGDIAETAQRNPGLSMPEASAAGTILETPFDLGKQAFSALGTAASAITSPLSAPASAGAATGGDPDQLAVTATLGQGGGVGQLLAGAVGGFANFATGIERIVEGDVAEGQKQDMRRAGYDPDSWTDRYGWYADVHGKNDVQSERWVNRLKSEGKNPYKVDLVREIVTSGVDDDQSRWGGLSQDAQRMLLDIQGNRDSEGAEIFKVLHSNTTSLGAGVADAAGYEPGTGQYTAVTIVGDLAAYWYLDPLVVGGKALNAYRYAKFGVEVDPHAVREAIAAPGTKLANRWDSILDSADKIHVLRGSAKSEDQAAAAVEYERFRSVHGDAVDLLPHLLRMREGSVTGTVLRRGEIPDSADWRDVADFRKNLLDINEVADPKKYKPVFSLRTNAGDEVTQETRDAARAEIADRLGDAIFVDTILSGRPIVGGQILLPGQHKFSSAVARPLRHAMDAILGQKGKLLDQLKAAEAKGLVDFTQDARGATAHLVDSAKGGDWIRENYTRGGLRDRLAMTASKFALTKDAPLILLDDAHSAADIYRFTRFFAPRGQAAYMAVQWAGASPAARSVMLSNLMDSLGHARHALGSKSGSDFWRQQLKQRESVIRDGEPVREAYSYGPKVDLIDTDAGPVAAAMYSTQFSEGVRLPSFVDILRNTEKVGVLSALAGASHSRYVSAFTRAMKVGQVGTTSNMLRQAIDGRTLQVLDNPLSALHTFKARLGLIGETAAERAASNQLVRDARKLRDSDKLDALVSLHGRRDYAAYAALGKQLLGDKANSRLLELMEQGADVAEIARSRSALRLAASRVAVDPLRRGRAKLYSRLAPDRQVSYEWLEEADNRLGDRLSESVTVMLGGQAARYMDPAMVDDIDQMRQGLEAGQRLQMLRLRRIQGYLGAVGDVGATRWGNALGLRLADPVGAKVLAAVARAAVHEANVVARIAKARGKAIAANRGDPDTLERIERVVRSRMGEADDPAKIAGDLIAADEKYRLHGRRGQYIDGKFVGGTADQDAALRAWGEQMADDAAHYLGLKAGVPGADEAHRKLLETIADEGQISQGLLHNVADEFRPDAVHAPIIVGKQFAEPHGGPMTERVMRGASKIYDFVVANPLRRMVHDPQVLAAHNEVAVALEPMARAMQAKGMSAKTIYDTVDALAYGHAINRVMRYNDNPNVQSYFAVLSNNFLWYERAMEDWARRATAIVKADPAIIARAHLMWESAAHSGMVQKAVSTDEEGNARTDYVFAWPGSGLALRAINEGMQALRLSDEPVMQLPVWQNFTSPVRYLSPSLQNPLGFTTTPVVGAPMRAFKALFPEHTLAVDSALTTLEGGERSFGSQDLWESLTPVYMKRAINSLSREERDSQFASATRNTLIYMQAAGRLPATDAPEADHQRARDEMRQMVGNLVLWRNLMGSFLPATPGTMNSNPADIGDDDLNVFDRARGVTTIRGEWFQLLEDTSKRYPQDSNRAFSEAATEWMRRDMGSILDQTAFTVGSSQPVGVEDGAGFGSNIDLTQWMLDNRSFLDSYGQAAFKLLPEVGDNGYYSKLGYSVQLRTGVRQHKDLERFYGDLVVKQTDTTFYAALEERSRRLAAASSKAEQSAAYDWFNGVQEELRRANPLWAMDQNDTRDVDYIASRVAPAVARMAQDPNLPTEVAQYQPQLQVMAALWDEYRTLLATTPGLLYRDVQARKSLTKRYGAKGDELFAGGPLNDLWKTMRAWES